MVKAAVGFPLQSLAQIPNSNNYLPKVPFVPTNTIQTPGPFSLATGIQPKQRDLREISLSRGLRKLRRPED